MKHRVLLALFSAATLFGAPATVHLLQKPAMNKTTIVFSYAGDLWTVSRQGGMATRLTVGAGQESAAAFSPDGETVAARVVIGVGARRGIVGLGSNHAAAAKEERQRRPNGAYARAGGFIGTAQTHK